MTLSVNNDQISMGSEVYYDEDWHIVLESHLLVMKQPQITTVLTINPHDAYKYEGDLYSLLQAYNVLPQYHFPIMRTNDMYSPLEYKASMTNLLVPATQFIESLRNLYQTISSKLV
jgi:hypothetical protein